MIEQNSRNLIDNAGAEKLAKLIFAQKIERY